MVVSFRVLSLSASLFFSPSLNSRVVLVHTSSGRTCSAQLELHDKVSESRLEIGSLRAPRPRPKGMYELEGRSRAVGSVVSISPGGAFVVVASATDGV